MIKFKHLKTGKLSWIIWVAPQNKEVILNSLGGPNLINDSYKKEKRKKERQKHEVNVTIKEGYEKLV